MQEPPRLLLFPGLGGDARFFHPQASLPVALSVAEWIEPESRIESLAHYAHRMAEPLRGQRFQIVGGVSLGAVVALEAAQSMGVGRVILIGGCASHRDISPLFRATLKIAATMPTRLIRPATWLAPLALKLFEGLDRDQIRLMTRMLRARSPNQMRWSCRALLEWECCDLPPQAPVHAIHGERDEVIPLANVKPERVVPGARHLISLSRPREVNEFIIDKASAPGA